MQALKVVVQKMFNTTKETYYMKKQMFSITPICKKLTGVLVPTRDNVPMVTVAMCGFWM